MIANLAEYIFSISGTRPMFGVELEFYMISAHEDAICRSLCELFSVFIVKESAEHQYEIQTIPTMDLRDLSENLVRIKEYLVNEVEKFGGFISFTAKPFQDKPGSSMHVNITLVNAENYNCFSYKNGECNKLLGSSIGGLCRFMKPSMVAFAPLENSYLRFQNPDIHTPTTISWGRNNRSAAIRIPASGATRVEHRVPCSDVNFNRVFEMILKGIVLGVKLEINPPMQVYGVTSDKQYNLERLPLSLRESLECSGLECIDDLIKYHIRIF